MKLSKVNSLQQPKSLEHKMCKKVAELTQIIHSMFVKSTEFELKHKAIVYAYENEIKSIQNEFQNREKDLIEKNKEFERQIQYLIKKRENIVEDYEEKIRILKDDKPVGKDFSCQFPSINEGNDIEKKSVTIEKLNLLNYHMRNKINKLETKIMNERLLNLKLINRLKCFEENMKKKNYERNLIKKESVNRVNSLNDKVCLFHVIKHVSQK
jgi:hypothetical protein